MKTSWVRGSAATLCLLAAGCGSVIAPPGTRVAVRRADGPTLAGNRRLSWQEARKLLALVPVPAGARPLPAPPVGMSLPPLGEPVVTGLADAEQSWRLDMPASAAASWIAAHRPAGLKQLAHMSGTPYLAGYEYEGPARPAWGSAALQVGVAPAGPGQSFMRADALVVWLDPVPYQDTAKGPRLRVLAAGRCPATDAGIAGVRNPGSHLTRSLLPGGRPSAALRCAYYGMNGKRFRLKAAHRLGPAAARALAVAIARIPVSHEVGVTSSCPADDRSAVLVAFAYPGRPDVDLWAEVTGCPAMANGSVAVAGQLP